jgi:hypothetical protein
MTDNQEQEHEALPSAEEMTKLLWAHADTTAERVLDLLGGPLSSNNLSRFLEGGDSLRYPTEILFSEEGLEEHQFAEPVFYAGKSGQCCMLHIHPRYQNYPEAIPYLVAYMAAPINYGDSADGDLCEHLGAMLVKQEREEFYARVCQLADWRP